MMKQMCYHFIYFFSQILKRGAPPEGGGEVVFTCPARRNLWQLQFTDPAKIKRIRGLVYPVLFPLVKVVALRIL